MAKVAIIRCEKNAEKCPMTNCLACLIGAEEGFSGYDSCIPVGVFTCRCPGDRTVELAGILKTKGAEAIHFCTCAFASKSEQGWTSSNGGFCEHIDDIIEGVHKATGLKCVKGTAHLPGDHALQVWA